MFIYAGLNGFLNDRSIWIICHVILKESKKKFYKRESVTLSFFSTQ